MNASCVLGTRAMIQSAKMEIISNNLANTDTPGFKADHLSLNLTRLPAGRQDGYVRKDDLRPTLTYYTDFSAGNFRATGNPLDFALEGEGFFSVDTPEGVKYTRNGSFTVNKDGLLVTQEGFAVLGDTGPIQITGEDTRCDQEGNIYSGDEQVAKLRIVTVDDKAKLSKTGDSFFSLNEGAVAVPAEGALVRQGFLEGSNVSVIRAMTEMIETLRDFEAYQKLIQTIDENTSKSVNEVGRIS